MIGSVSSTNPLIGNLQANGLSGSKAKLVESEMDAAVEDVAVSSSAGTKPDTATVREALDKRIAADVKSGKLSKDDAAEIKTTLDQMDAQSGQAKAPRPAVLRRAAALVVGRQRRWR